MIQDIFKTPLYKESLSLNNKEMASYCYTLQKDNKGRTISNIGGWQSDDLKGIHKPFEKLIDTIIIKGNSLAQTLDMNKVRLYNIWVNINGYKDTNISHSHTHSIFSGVYYVNVPNNGGNIVFEHPTYDTIQYDWNHDSVKSWNAYNSSLWTQVSKTGDILLFPSWLKHYVKPNLNKKEKRISLSFNLVYK